MVSGGDVIGRDAERAVLQRLTADAVQGRGGNVVIEGEPGIGKSALLGVALTAAEAAGCRVLVGQCDELAERFPLSAMMQLLRMEPAAVALEPGNAPLASGPGWSMQLLAGDPVATATEHLLARVDELCGDGPLVLALEDLQWADEATLLMWRRLGRATVQLPLLVVATCRPVPRPPELERLRRELGPRGGQLVSLDRLAEAHVSEYAASLLGRRPGPRLMARLESATGNPLYVRELLDALSRGRALREAGGLVELVTEGSETEHVVALGDVISDRLSALSQDTREALRAAALLGPEFSATDLAVSVGRGLAGLLPVVEEALNGGVLESVGSRLRFRHSLLKEVLRESLATALRSALRRSVAQALISARTPVERVAELILADPDVAEGWELDWLADNAERLVNRSPATSAVLLEQAIAHTTPEDPRFPVLAGHLAELCHRMGRPQRARQLVRSLLPHSQDSELVSRGRWLLITIADQAARLEEVVAEWHAAAEDSRVGALWRPRFTAMYARTLVQLDRHDEALEALNEALADAERLADTTGMGYALYASVVLRGRRGEYLGALDEVDRALAAIRHDPGLLDLRLTLLGIRGSLLDGADRLKEAEDTIALARNLAERVGSARLSITCVHSGMLKYEHGRWDDALEVLGEATGLPGPEWRWAHRGLLALVHAQRDEWEKAGEHLEAVQGEEVEPGHPYAAACLLVARSLAAQRAGRLSEAVGILSVLLTPRYIHHRRLHSALPVLVRTALAAGDEHTARVAEGVALREAQREPLPRAQAAADWCAGLVRRDPARLRAAVDYLRSVERLPDLGCALEDLAVVHAGVGDLADARAAGMQAIGVHTEVGATWNQRRTIGRLRRQGIRLTEQGPRSRPSSGWAALTVAETLVAELVAQGLSNPEIAARLQLSRRTVETHVSKILMKLGIRSRREVAAAARAEGNTADPS